MLETDSVFYNVLGMNGKSRKNGTLLSNFGYWKDVLSLGKMKNN
jgi:ribosomal protein S16